MRSALMQPAAGPLDFLGPLNPFGIAGDAIGEAAASAWVGIMWAIFDSGLWILRLCLSAVDYFMTPDLSENGPAAEVYKTTFWVAATLLTFMAVAQIGVAVFRRDGKSLGRVLLGAGQFVGVWFCWIAYSVAIVAAAGGLTKALMKSMLNIDNWSEWNPLGYGNAVSDSMQVALATVLGVMGIFLWVAAIGHFVIMLMRAVALLILGGTSVISAAGLVSESGKSWFWKSVRWFHAAALTPVLSVLILGIGVQLTAGIGQGFADSTEETLGTALPAVVIIVISIGSPVVLFRLLAFVDPGTSSGASMRAGLDAAGGLGGLLGGQSGGGQSSAASSSSDSGQSQGEQQSSDATSSRMTGAIGGMLGAYGLGIQTLTSASGKLSSVGADEMNQTAVGSGDYFPDQQGGSRQFNPDQRDTADTDGGDSSQGGGGGGQPPAPPSPPNPPSSPPPGGGGAPGGGGGAPGSGGGGAAAGGGAAGGGGAAAAGGIPPVA